MIHFNLHLYKYIHLLPKFDCSVLMSNEIEVRVWEIAWKYERVIFIDANRVTKWVWHTIISDLYTL